MIWKSDNPEDPRVLRQKDIDFIVFALEFLSGSTYDDDVFEKARTLKLYLEGE